MLTHHRRRYDKAEQEYIESKIQMQKKREMKETLTEHLMVVIQQVHVHDHSPTHSLTPPGRLRGGRR